MHASKNGHSSAVQALIKVGNADINKSNNIGVTALLYASNNGHGAVVNLLLKQGNADIK